MIKEELEAAINAQINQELEAAYAYLGMATYFDSVNLDGFAHWMSLQHAEEQVHAMRLLRYLQDRGGRVRLDAIEKPQAQYEGHREAFERALVLEQENTESINSLYALAAQLEDYATKSHLQWFVDEQVEEEKSLEDILTMLDRIGDNVTSLLFLNDKLGARAVAPSE